MKALTTLFKTDHTISTLVLRLTLGVVFFPHGAQKVLGWFGGYGFTGTMGFFTGTMHIPALFAFLAIAAFFLWTEHRAHVLGVLPWLLLAVCPLMHLFMHGGHGGHSDHHGRGNDDGPRGADG